MLKIDLKWLGPPRSLILTPTHEMEFQLVSCAWMCPSYSMKNEMFYHPSQNSSMDFHEIRCSMEDHFHMFHHSKNWNEAPKPGLRCTGWNHVKAPNFSCEGWPSWPPMPRQVPPCPWPKKQILGFPRRVRVFSGFLGCLMVFEWFWTQKYLERSWSIYVICDHLYLWHLGVRVRVEIWR